MRSDLGVPHAHPVKKAAAMFKREVQLRQASSSPRAARLAVADYLTARGRTDLCADAVLVASELVSNAVLYAREPIRLGLSEAGEGLRIEVFDGGCGSADVVVSPADFQKSTGRGLRVVQQIAARWGAIEHADGKTVWAELRSGTG